MTTSPWIDVGVIGDIPRRGARTIQTPNGDIAIFRTVDDRIFALEDRCPHKAGKLSQGIVHDHKVTCPLHDWVIDLASGEAQGADTGCAHAVDLKLVGDRIQLNLAAVCRKVA
jgi:nitrite reductase (NADH) small subunit